MKFADKKRAYQRMQFSEHVDADRELLKKKSPEAYALVSGILNKEKAQREILWSLLEVATVEEIEANRKVVKASKNADRESALYTDLSTTLSSDLPETEEGILAEKEKIGDLVKKIGEDSISEKLEEVIVSRLGKLKDALNSVREKAEEDKRTLENELLSLDIENADQKNLSRLAKGLKIETKDQKAVTLKPVLEAYRLNLEKEDRGEENGPKKEEIPAEPGKENNLEVENDDLKNENIELQNENDDLREENDDLQDKIEEEKKSQKAGN